ncbi:MAG: hypothetical protein KDA28_12100, partial [Phycisphaerales bacterium]|nr:hypothetical protein [Phycisphaerales bacterium]
QLGVALMMYAEDQEEMTPREAGFQRLGERLNPTWAFHLRPYVDERATHDAPHGGIDEPTGDKFERAEYYRCPTHQDDGQTLHYVANGLMFLDEETTAWYGKPPTPMHRYVRPFDTIYLSDISDELLPEHLEEWYSSRSSLRLAIYYDLHDIENIILEEDEDGEFNTNQRTAPFMHGNGANGMFLDGHAVHVQWDEITSVQLWNDYDYRPNERPR